MPPEDLNLTDIKASSFELTKLDFAYKMDPPPFLLKYLDKTQILKINKIKYENLALTAELQTKMFKDIANVFR